MREVVDMTVIELKDVTYYYFEQNLILDHVSAQFERGKMYVLFGPSGSGKTTLLSLLGGLDSPRSGAVLFEGKNIAGRGLAYHRRHHVSFVFQNYNLIDYMTPIENVNLLSRKDALPVLERLGLTREESRRNVLKLSGGQQQRVAIARALISDNPVILADEPTGNLDEDTAHEITEIFKQTARDYNKCVIIVSHSLELARQADVLYEVRKGTLIHHASFLDYTVQM